MSIKMIEVQDIHLQWLELMDFIAKGNEVAISKNTQPVARLLPPLPPLPRKRTAGLHKGAMTISDDFDAPLSDEFWLGKDI
jgi:antitoxin (DNA-binding transcriptional repressor) of toxin-antitoxin stability system